MEISGLTMVGGAAAVGLVVGMWEKVKGFLHNLSSVAVVNVSVEGAAAYAMSMYIVRHFKRFKFGDVSVTGVNEYVRPEKQNQLIAFKVFPNKGTFWRKGRRLIWVKSKWRGVQVSFLRGTFNTDKFIFEAIQFFNASKKHEEGSDRFFVVRKQGTVGEKMSAALKAMTSQQKEGESPEGFDTWGDMKADKYSSQPVGWEFDDIGQPFREDAIDVLSLSPEVMAAYADIKDWRGKEKWYKDHMIPWKLGQLYTGLAGTGKTVTVRAIGQDMNMPIFIMDIASMTNNDFVEAWAEVMDWSPCIVLIEEIGKIYDGTKRIADTGEEPGLTFDCLLNVLDGVENTDGIITIMTANDITKVDPTLGGMKGVKHGDEERTRPGRIDRVVHFDVLDEEGCVKMATRILDEYSEEVRQEVVREGIGMTGADFQNLCRKRARHMNGDGNE